MTFAVLAISLTGASLLLHEDYQRQASEAIRGERTSVEILATIVMAVSGCREHEIGVVRNLSDPQARSSEIRAWEDAYGQLERIFEPFLNDDQGSRDHETWSAGPDFSGRIKNWRYETTRYRRLFHEFVGRIESGEIQSVSGAVGALEPVTDASSRLISAARRESEYAASSAESAELRLESHINRGKLLVITRGLIPLGILVFLSISFSRLILRRLAILADTLRRIAAGDLSARAPIDADDEIGVVARHLNEMAETIQLSQQRLEESRAAALNASQSKSQFLANASHEIRTPMTAILGFADELSRSAIRPEDADLAGTIARNGQHLLHVINDILDLSKIEAGKLVIQHERISLRDLLAEVQRLMRLRIENRALCLSFENQGPLPESIETDPTRLRQILINLIGNAIKFTEKGSVRVVTTVERQGQHDATLRFDVIDTGEGIAPEQLARLFQPFSQVDAQLNRHIEGTGLGLVICKRLAEGLGGDISVVSEPGVGSTFTVSLVLRAVEGVRWVESDFPSSGEIVVADPVVENLQQMRILVVEDGPDNQRLIDRMLKRAGARVEMVSNGAEALAAVARAEDGSEFPFDVILMDMQMPVLNGYEATQRLRSGGYARPIVALTANAMQHDRQRCLDAGCDDYLTKPIQPSEMLRVVGRYSPAASQNQSMSATN